jgi:hypothetical protein
MDPDTEAQVRASGKFEEFMKYLRPLATHAKDVLKAVNPHSCALGMTLNVLVNYLPAKEMYTCVAHSV